METTDLLVDDSDHSHNTSVDLSDEESSDDDAKHQMETRVMILVNYLTHLAYQNVSKSLF